MITSFFDKVVLAFIRAEREQLNRAYNFLETGESFENTNALKIWSWGLKRYGMEFSYREYQLRELV